MKKPKYPIYVISKGRADIGRTAKFMLNYGVKFKLVIKPQEYNENEKYYDEK